MDTRIIVATTLLLGSASSLQPSAPKTALGFDTWAEASALGLPGDYGFDPLNFAASDLFFSSAENKNRDSVAVLKDYRDSEIRHGRLAMLAALAWPVQELAGPYVARFANQIFGASGLSDILTETSGRSPSVLNGGLEHVGGFVLCVAGLIGALDLAALDRQKKEGDAYVPGNYGFDPLRLMQGATAEQWHDMQTKEVNNGRLAMVALTAYVAEEAISKAPITEITPGLFTPLIYQPWFLHQMDSAFEVASAAQRISGDEVNRFIDAIPK